MGDEDAIVKAIPDVERLIGPEELAEINRRFGELEVQTGPHRAPI
jgi:hypothetical protein